MDWELIVIIVQFISIIMFALGFRNLVNIRKNKERGSRGKYKEKKKNKKKDKKRKWI